MNIVRASRKNRYAVYLLTALLVVAGVAAMFELPSSIYPELVFPRIVILAHAGDLAPETMILTVTRPLEQAAQTVLGVRRVRSQTIRGACEISVLFNPDMDMPYALQLMQARVGATRGQLPADAEVSVERITPSAWPILMLTLGGNVPETDLRDFAFFNLRPLFTGVPGVSQVEVQASRTREVSIIVDPEKLVAHRLSLVEVANRLEATNAITSVGRLDKDYARYLIVATGRFRNLDDIRNAVVAVENGTPVRVNDIARVRFGTTDPRLLVYENGRPAVLISVARQIGGNILAIAGKVKAIAGHPGSAIPASLRLSVVYDLAGFVHQAVGSIRDAVILGALLVLLVLFVFLREARTTVIAAVSLPITVAGTFFFLRIFHGTVNLMSLGGVAIAIGLVIDDAVVIVENIYRHLGLGEAPEVAAERGVSELLAAVLGSTATTVVVFSPLSLLSGVVGEFFSALCLTLAIAVLLSLVFSLSLIPLLSQQFLKREHHKDRAEEFIAPINRAYERAVRWALRRRKAVALATVASLGLAAFFYTRVETGFLPVMDEGGFVLDNWTRPGTSLAQTDQVDHQLEEETIARPEVQAVLRRTGAEMGPFATQQNTGEIIARLKPRAPLWRRLTGTVPRSERTTSIFRTMAALRQEIGRTVPGVRVEFTQVLQDMIADMEGSPAPIEVKLFGPNMQVLERLAGEASPKLERIPGIVDFRGITMGNPEVMLHVDPAAAGKLGMTVDQVSQQVGAGLLGLTESSYREGDRTIGIRVRLPDSFRYNYDDIRQFPIVAPGGKVVPLASIAEIERAQGESDLKRENGRLMVALAAGLEHRGLGSAVHDIRQALRTVSFPVGTYYEIGGQYESQQRSFHDLLRVLLLAIAAVFIVLVIQFRSFAPALIILSAAPLSLVGVFGILWATGTALNVSSFMGIVLMVGLVVKNAIILFDYVHKLWEEQGMPLDEALVAAGKIRVRPILMSTLCTLFGLLPLAIGIGAGAELQKPLALAVIGGLCVSAFATLFVMPVLYALLGRSRTAEAR